MAGLMLMTRVASGAEKTLDLSLVLGSVKSISYK